MDFSNSVGVAAHQLVTRSGGLGTPESRPPVYKTVGLILAVCSGLFIGVSFVLKKIGLLKANVKYNEEAGEGYGYLKNFWWWAGMTLMIIGEICNFAAYAFVDAILVTPLGALSVVVTTILSTIFLKERLSFVGKVGCFNCIIGSVVIVINAPTQSAVATIQDMKRLVISPGFLSYAGVVIVVCTVVALWLGPKYGKKTMMVYISICSLIGGLSVVATQGLGAAIIAQASGVSQFKEWFLYVLFVFVVITLLVEIIFLNKALNLFNAALVTPTYYVFFTSSTIVTSAILFRGFKGTAATISTVIMGFLQICAGVVLLQLSKSAKDVPDAAVFNGDLDQVRTVAEQEEPEYEPKADTIRGGASIIRTLSTARQRKEAEEAKRIHNEMMAPIGENEQVEWDGLRRRKTTISSVGSGGGGLHRQKTIHPPLGMSYFPAADDDHSDDDESLHPGFFTRLRSRGRSLGAHHTPQPVPLDGIETQQSNKSVPNVASRKGSSREHVYGVPSMQDTLHEDTSYHSPASSGAIHWAGDVTDDRAKSTGHLGPPKPGNANKRQFSFQSVFQRHKSESAADASQSDRPLSRSGLSFSSRKSNKDHGRGLDGTTEEERLGLVKGDSHSILGTTEQSSSPPEYSDAEEGWLASHKTKTGVGSPADSHPRSTDTSKFPQFDVNTHRRQRDAYDDDDDDDDDDSASDKSHGKDIEKGGSGGGGGAFL